MFESRIARKGTLTMEVRVDRMDRVRINGMSVRAACFFAPHRYRRRDGALIITRCNAYVRSGLRNSLLREGGIGGAAWAGIGLASSTSAVTVDTRYLNGATAGTNGAVAGQNVSIKAATPTISTDGAGLAQILTIGNTWTTADFNGGVPFTVSKAGIVLAVPASGAVEVDGNLVDVIGGTGGTSPYNKSIGLDIANAGLQSLGMSIAVTALAL